MDIDIPENVPLIYVKRLPPSEQAVNEKKFVDKFWQSKPTFAK